MLYVGRSVRATPAAAWQLISSTDTWSSWGPSVSGVDPPETTIFSGMRGRVRVPLGAWLPFTITVCEAPRVWAWSVLGLPATRHEVHPAPGGCRVRFGVPVGAPAYLLVCRVALDRIASMLESGQDPARVRR